MTELEQLFHDELKKRGYWFPCEHAAWEAFRVVMERVEERKEGETHQPRSK
jgi:hypothetical protein